ncbi:ABC transporter permease [Poseidonocella sedimentorum]|uniref:ABC-type proline/glycine betaine transport system, permease component n=1 Tax=Poseidonocella sedimentorum TaxID=871652 RepID=A0A1I6DLP8_9RHOB|nr:ABC transporter permease subunit [Poseidonocella sedimentorum]SFR06326.1 ABC-type proline/glycine betaine transport system, permease component [Poseidonocella sedimentorum]
MTTPTETPFAEFAETNGAYYADVFLKIQKSALGRFHINTAALFGSFIWAALRANWTLFLIGFVIDLIALVNLSLYFKYAGAAIENADKEFLVNRYETWAQGHIISALVVFVLGRLLFGWLADRLYVKQYSKWRIDRATPSGFSLSRLGMAGLIVLLIVPLMLYRSSQFAPDERSCIRQDRAIAAGEEVPFKAKFDCFMIGEFPTLIWIDRPDKVTYPRDDNGERTVLRTPAREGAPPVTLSTFVADKIDNGIGYLTVFYGVFFDGITVFLRVMLNAISAVFVGTPWMIAMGVLTFAAYAAAGTRIAVFVGVSLFYLAIFGFWQAAMDTLSLVAAASIICVVAGLPLGIWVGKSERGRAIFTPVLDVMQTIPSFVYLLPAIAFFSIGKPPGILATVIFAMPPMVRLTALGLQQVPETTKEAALAFGANPRQLLTKVELPLAMPSIMAGINQVVMMSLSMVVIAALIGAGGMGYIVTEALENTETGRGILAGAGIALLAMMIDKVVQRASNKT